MTLELQYEKESINHIFKKIKENIPEDVYTLPSEWNEKNRILTPEFTDKPGIVSYNESPFWREVVDCLAEGAETSEIGVMKGGQIGATTMILEAYIAYRIAVAPCPMLYTSADNELAEENMQSRIDAMIKTTNLGKKIKPGTVKKGSRKTGDTKKQKEFAGGFITAMGLNNPGKLRQRGFKVLLADEIDEYSKNLKGQGSAISLLDARTQAFARDSKKMKISTPTNANNSNIETIFNLGTKEYYQVPCPHCGEFQKLELGDGKNAGLRFERDEEKILISDSVYYQCVNGCRIEEHEKKKMLIKGKWVATQKPRKKGLRSFQLSTIYSNFMTWEDVIQKFLEAKDNKEKLKVFTNTVLGEPFLEIVKPINISNVKSMLREYAPYTIPNNIAEKDGNGKIAVITCGVDVNGNYNEAGGWLAVEIKGHCLGGQTYSVAKGQVYGNTEEGGSAWKALERITQTPIMSDCGEIEYFVNLTAVDVGFKPDSGYYFQANVPRVVCVAGDNIRRKNSRIHFKTMTAKGERYTLDTVYYKNFIANALNKRWKKTDFEQPANFMNFPSERKNGGFEGFDFTDLAVIVAGYGYDDEYFKCLKAEIPVIEKEDEKDEAGQIVAWKKIHTRSPNHFWDCMVYNYAALDIFINEITYKYLKIKKADKNMVFRVIIETLEKQKIHWH